MIQPIIAGSSVNTRVGLRPNKSVKYALSMQPHGVPMDDKLAESVSSINGLFQTKFNQSCTYQCHRLDSA